MTDHTLTPVSGDPWAGITLTPVSHDPFAMPVQRYVPAPTYMGGEPAGPADEMFGRMTPEQRSATQPRSLPAEAGQIVDPPIQ